MFTIPALDHPLTAILLGALLGVAVLLGWQAYVKPDRARQLRAALRAIEKVNGEEDDAVEAAKRKAEQDALEDKVKQAAAKL